MSIPLAILADNVSCSKHASWVGNSTTTRAILSACLENVDFVDIAGMVGIDIDLFVVDCNLVADYNLGVDHSFVVDYSFVVEHNLVVGHNLG